MKQEIDEDAETVAINGELGFVLKSRGDEVLNVISSPYLSGTSVIVKRIKLVQLFLHIVLLMCLLTNRKATVLTDGKFVIHVFTADQIPKSKA